MARVVDISSDIGERPGSEGLAADIDLLGLITSANVACGGHAGDRTTMRVLSEAAAERDVAVGAQVSYVDPEGFGRRRLDVPTQVLIEQLHQQWGALTEAAIAAGTTVSYLRPHGALYNTALVDEDVAAAVVAAAPVGTPVLCLAGTALARAAVAADLPHIPELFADRAVLSSGLLVPRGREGAVIDDEVVVRERLGRWLRDGTLVSIDGVVVTVPARSICVHSDTVGATDLAALVRDLVESQGSPPVAFAGRASPGIGQ